MRAVALAALLFVAPAVAEPLRTQAPKVWPSLDSCWASVWPSLAPFIEDLGFTRIVANDATRVEHEVVESKSGRVAFRAGCVRVPGKDAVFRRFFEFPGN